MPVTAIILAAGASRRLGRPKQLVRIAGETLLARTVRMALESGATPVFVVLGAEGERILTEVDLSGAIPVLNAEWESGMASSVRAGILAVQEQAAALPVMLLVCDQARLTAEHLCRLMAAAETTEAAMIASSYGGVLGVPAIFAAGEVPALLALRGDAGARSLLSGADRGIIAIEFEGGAADIDTLDDLRKAVETAGFEA